MHIYPLSIDTAAIVLFGIDVSAISTPVMLNLQKLNTSFEYATVDFAPDTQLDDVFMVTG